MKYTTVIIRQLTERKGKPSLAKKAGIKQDFTAKQFLSAIGYSIKSQSQLDKISSYNNKLKEYGLISITTYRDELGHTRNVYIVND